jgi:hypothetical protein
MRDEPRAPVKHQLDHAVPTVIHHPEEDLPVLARWLHGAMANQTRFWSVLGGIVVAVVLISLLTSSLSSRSGSADAAWTELEAAKTAEERLEIARKYPNTRAERWAILQAASSFYDKGFADLPANRDVALADLKKALEYFQQAAREAPKDSPEAPAAAFGIARTHEARNELAKAIEQYEYVNKTWPDTDEGRQAKRLAEALRKPENVAFYKELYTYKAPEVTIPPQGQQTIPLPPGHPPVDGSSTVPAPLLPPPPPLSTATPKSSGSDTLPENVFQPPAAPSTSSPSSSPAPETKEPAPKP